MTLPRANAAARGRPTTTTRRDNGQTTNAVQRQRWWRPATTTTDGPSTSRKRPDLVELGDGMACPPPVVPDTGRTDAHIHTSASHAPSNPNSQSFDEEGADDMFTAAMTEAAAAATASPPRAKNRGPTLLTRNDRPRQLQRAMAQQIPTAHEALELLRERLSSGSMPSQRQDPFKLGLVVEGGGMRGCVSGGALQAIGDLGLKNAFDAVYGSSAGAINGTYFLSGQRHGVDIYHKHIASTEFIDLKRLLSSKPGTPAALNLEFLLGEVMERVLPLDVDAVLESPIPLKVIASSLDSLSPVLLENFESKHDLIESLRASACVPKVAGTPVFHRDHRLVDAAVFEAVPFRSAIADGCTHAIVLCTRPLSKKRSRFGKVLEATIKRAVLNPDYMQDAWAASVEYLTMNGLSHDEMLMRALEKDAHERYSWFAGAHVLPLYPDPRSSTFSPLCTDVETLRTGVAEGRRMVTNLVKLAKLPVESANGSNISTFMRRREQPARKVEE